MSEFAERLYRLLPAVYRIRDAEQDGVLKALLEVIGEQAEVMDDDIFRLYGNLFIETCEESLVSYIGDLLGVRGLHQVKGGTFTQRARVANTLRYRRRKGTAAMLEQAARDTTGWNARVVEFFQRLATTQHLNHLRPRNLRTPDLRDTDALALIGTPFDTTARTGDVRHIAGRRGLFNLPNVGIFLWGLQAYPVFRAPAHHDGKGHYRFSQLGHDAPLFNPPVTESDIGHLAEERNVPGILRRLPLYEELEGARLAIVEKREPHYEWFDRQSVFAIFLNGSVRPVPVEEITVCHLGKWNLPPSTKKYRRLTDDGTYEYVERPLAVAVDPVLGRIAFPVDKAPAKVEVRYSYGFSGDVGGGFYRREESQAARVYPVGKKLFIKTIKGALDAWKRDGRPSAVISVRDSEYYDDAIDIAMPAGVTLEIRAGRNGAGEQQRPVAILKAPLSVTGEAKPGAPGGTLVLDGLWITGDKVQVAKGNLGLLQLRHCTLVPGWGLNEDATATDPDEESVSVAGENDHLEVSLERSITGRVDAAAAERLSVQDSIIAAESGVAVSGGRVTIERSTVLGGVEATVVELASDSIFTGTVTAERIQEGCARFCYLPRDSKAPRRYRCQPDLAIRKAEEAAKREFSDDERTAIAIRVQPVFSSTKYGTHGFCRLHSSSVREIAAGASDESEMGVFNHLQQPQREANLLSSLDEYLRAGLEAGVFHVDQDNERAEDRP